MLRSQPFQRSPRVASSAQFDGLIPGTLSRPVNILILGIDNTSQTDQGLGGNSDTMLLLRIEPTSREVTILSIPRDTLVQFPDIGGDKINAANARGGITLVESTVSQLLDGVPVERYVRLGTNGLIQFADALGGVEIDVPKQIDYEDRAGNLSIHFKPGRQHLNGQRLQEYVRFRHDALGDIGRVQRQQAVLKALLQKFANPTTIARLPLLYQAANQNLDTDLSIAELLAVGQSLKGVDRSRLNLVGLPGRFSREDEYPLSYWIADPEQIEPLLTRYFKPRP